MNDPERALKNAVFEYLLATNNVKSAEVFFKESNLQSQYDVSVDVMVHNTHLYGSSCLICKLFNNWYNFAHNQRLITPEPSVLVHHHHKDENLEHMQQFLQFYHTHDKHNCTHTHIHPHTTNNNNDTMETDSANFPLPPPPNSPPHSHFHTPPQSTSTITTASPTSPTTTPFNPPPNFAVTSPNPIQSPASPPSNPTAMVSSPTPTVESGNELPDKSSETIAKENEYLFSVERKLFNTLETPPTDSTITNSDTLLQLLTINPLPLPPTPAPVTPSHSPNIYSPSPARHHPVPPQVPPTTEEPEPSVDLNDIEANIEKCNKAGRFCCPYPNCSKSFSTSAILKRHIKEHSGDRPYKCTFEGCGKGFARNYDLKVHMRSHTGEKPYRCTFMGCERTFTRSSDLRLHERIHKGEKPFVCDCAGCQKRFVRYADLKKHKRTHEVHEGHHPHVHGAGCGHTAIAHEDHIDYLHDAHLHNHHKDHIDDHKIGLSESNPNACTHSEFICDPTHTHNENCGHELVPHYDHYDYLVDGHLHFVHDSHCDDHGWIDVVTWNPSDFHLEGSPSVGTGETCSGTGEPCGDACTHGEEDSS
eukprot:Phypoly_transcript_03548.p1 GENE.Phypoly_transcript_03548~~Phypoly_transcript_03548.p1  ORF type:complete len:588 (+),score=107.17 Phypoly_transcript_03548:215-1978(+)